MTTDPRAIALLKEKAMLLLRRERELAQFRQDRTRTEKWLGVFHSLTLHLQHREELIRSWASLLIQRMGFQAVAIYEQPATSAPFRLEHSEPERFSAELCLEHALGRHIRDARHGRYDRSGGPEELADLATATQLAKFYWVSVPVNDGEWLLIAGFSPESARFHTLNDTDQGHFVMFSNHLGALLNNLSLLGNLFAERTELQHSNDELDKSLQHVKTMQVELMRVSRTAGMAEIATGILHNVGNILNSANVSSEVIADKLRAMRLGNQRKAVAMLDGLLAERPELAADPRVNKLATYFRALTDQLERDRDEIVQEHAVLRRQIDHIKVVVSKQQQYAKPAAVVERCELRSLVDETVALVASSYHTRGVTLVVQCDDVSGIVVDRHQLIQILVNLLTNAMQAVSHVPVGTGRVSIAGVRAGRDRLNIQVSDNGVGIAPDHLERMFSHGFTTKKDGHGFGLHNAAIAAKGMGGRLSCQSGGVGLGATFHLDLPMHATGYSGEPLQETVPPPIRQRARAL